MDPLTYICLLLARRRIHWKDGGTAYDGNPYMILPPAGVGGRRKTS